MFIDAKSHHNEMLSAINTIRERKHCDRKQQQRKQWKKNDTQNPL